MQRLLSTAMSKYGDKTYMASELSKEVIIICEGAADKNFFRKLIEKRSGLPQFDIPFPMQGKDLGGVNAFKHWLEAIRGDRRGFSKLKGVLLVADSASNPISTFNDVCTQIKNATGYAIPTKPDEVTPRVADYPQVAVMLIPNESSPGGLESLCVSEITNREPWISTCVNKFLSCGNIQALKWSPEKLDKARYHSMISALNEDDPSRALSYAFKDPNPVISVENPCFDEVYNKLKNFCLAVGAS